MVDKKKIRIKCHSHQLCVRETAPTRTCKIKPVHHLKIFKCVRLIGRVFNGKVYFSVILLVYIAVTSECFECAENLLDF